ncbi:MAG: heme exporter protein CcmB [Myxococcota bacterium]|nr:heme exporter protein CcmB [Myxococcota bacterium]
MRFLKTLWVVFLKDIRVELRAREIVLTTALFALLVVILAGFAFGAGTLKGGTGAAGVLWMAIALCGILALSRTFERERAFAVFSAVLMTPAPRAAIYAGKALGVFVFLIIVEVIIIPLIELFFHAPLMAHAASLAPILLLATLGYAAVGTLFGAMTIRTQLRDLLLGVILYPLLAPLLIAAAKATEAVIDGQGLAAVADYLKLMAAADMLFIAGGLWLFGPLMED